MYYYILFILFFILIRKSIRVYVKDEKLEEIKRKLKIIIPEIDRFNFYADNETNIINKRDIFMCIKDKNNEYYDDNFLIYVALHEITHGLIKGPSGHPPEFIKKFNELKKLAIRFHIYNPNMPFPSNYCGKSIKTYFV